MDTRQINVSFVVNVDGHVVFRDIDIDWIVRDNAETIAKDIEEAINNIE